ncbi:hypothetical protein ABZP36_035335 [Zizania latifolia]
MCLCRQTDVAENRKAVVIHMPYRLRKAFKKIDVRLVRELLRRSSAARRIVRPPKKGLAVQCPRTRTLTAVYVGILEDVVYLAEIVGKRIKYRLDGAKGIKIKMGSTSVRIGSTIFGPREYPNKKTNQ